MTGWRGAAQLASGTERASVGAVRRAVGVARVRYPGIRHPAAGTQHGTIDFPAGPPARSDERPPTAVVSEDDDRNAPRFVVHIPFEAADPDEAMYRARELCGLTEGLSGVDVTDAAVSHEDAQHQRRQLFCDQRLRDSRRCRLVTGHAGICVGAPCPDA